jgi:alpha-L-rhamnosidase
MTKRALGIAWLIFIFNLSAHADLRINPELLQKRWSARWISVPGASPTGYGVYHFRRTFELKAKPASFVIHVTADNRYQLYVNGKRVNSGPARGDLLHWRFETVDIAPYLRVGKNVLAAVVWNFAEYAPEAQISRRTGFLLQGDTEAERIVDTGRAWRCTRNGAYRPLPVSAQDVMGYYAAGPGEQVLAARYPWGWELPDFDDADWPMAEEGEYGLPREAWDNRTRSAWELGASSWLLVPRSIPPMEERPVRLQKVRRSLGIEAPNSFPQQADQLLIPAHARVELLLDQSYLITAYPELIVSGGKDATISLRYAEALWVPGKHEKRNRDQVEGLEFHGLRDLFIADGGRGRLFRPLWWRAYRYLELKIETKDEPLVLEDLRGIYTGYPFAQRARFASDEAELQKILEIGWRTVRACAHETFMDCPYYEQLQYVGDARVQALVTFYMAGDGRLARNAIEAIDASRASDGLTMSRAPTRTPQYIPPFSLWWIGMLRDYWYYQDDAGFVQRMLPGVRAVLEFFSARLKENGSLGRVPWWNFVDWAREWAAGVPPVEDDGASALLDLQLLLAYNWAAEMERALGSKWLADEYERKAERLRAAIRELYWDSGRQLFADTPRKASFSQQTNALAILADVVRGEEARVLMRKILEDRSLVQCSIYFRHYLHSALNKVGEGDRYLDLLAPWREMIAQGLTTWAEIADLTTRSDCHGWGASPNYELFRTVLGIDSAAPGFRRVIIRPFLGSLKRASGTIPHPKGAVRVSLVIEENRLSAKISLPAGVTGELVWRGVRRQLPAGESSLVVRGR